MEYGYKNMKNELEQIFEFTSYCEALKKIERFKDMFYWRDYPKPHHYESVADHTWRLVLLLILFEKKLSKKIDLDRAVKIAIVHDIPEIIAGDASPLGSDGTGDDAHAFNKDVAKERHKTENMAAKEIFSKLPKKLEDEFYSCWQEIEEQKTYEAKVVKSLDRIECCMQIFEYRKGELFKGHYDINIKYIRQYRGADPIIDEFIKLIERKFRKSYKEFKK